MFVDFSQELGWNTMLEGVLFAALSAAGASFAVWFGLSIVWKVARWASTVF